MNKVELQFKRIQTYLFASPRLRAMLGANATLGRVIRIELTETAKTCGSVSQDELVQHLPHQKADDPLQPTDHCASASLVMDDPARIYRDYGVLVRDGGHFIATFVDENQARQFVQQAVSLITQTLPGILVDARIDAQPYDCAGDMTDKRLGKSLYQHPGFQVSAYQGNKPAAHRANQGFVSTDETLLEDLGKQFRQNAGDIIGFLERHDRIPHTDSPVQSLSDLTEDGYIGLIHADGNSVGRRYQEYAGPAADDLAQEAHGEHFFHSMRVAVRRALKDALDTIFDSSPKSYQLLMLGGDDLLLVSAARYALPFVQAYAKALENYDLADGRPLTIGTGVIIAKDSFPFHRLHAMAEDLADSAKRLARSAETALSTVDWHITSNAWINDPIHERRQGSLSADAVLSAKPYPILGDQSLTALLCKAKETQEAPMDHTLPRSPLRDLVDTMRQGRCLAELTYAELATSTRQRLDEILGAFGHDGLFKPQAGDTPLISVLPDLVEILELQRMKANETPEALS